MENETIQPNQGPAIEETLPEGRRGMFKLPGVRWQTLIVPVIIIVIAGLAFYYKGLFVAAKVDGHLISRMAVITQLERQSGKQALDILINKQLILNEADSKNIKVSSEELAGEFKKIEDQLSQQGMTLDQLYKSQNIGRGDLEKEILLQKKAEKMLGDKIAVSDQEASKYIKDNKINIAKGHEAEQIQQVKEQLRADKFSSEISSWISAARLKASIKTYSY